MENIFTAKDIKERLKPEHDQFKIVFTTYTDIMKDIKVESNSNV